MDKGNLVLTRGERESISIILGKDIDPNTPIKDLLDEIRISVSSIDERDVKLMVTANRAFRIVRSEQLK